MLKITIAAAITLALTGCTTTKLNYSPEKTFIDTPPINSINTAFIGEHLLQQGNIANNDMLNVTAPTNIAGYTIASGYFSKTGETREYEDYLPQRIGLISKPWYKDTPVSIRLYKNNTKACVITLYAYAVCDEPELTHFVRERIPTIQPNSFMQTLIYSGKIGNRINIGYREFSNDIARAAYSNEVEYDLSVSNIIGYKGARLEVIEANNEMIKYKVLKKFN
ncbi:hypothetical protein [Neptunomonas phycophila]|uniref:hypothetical protein n=1 Tax=Neptunomonas phycophila TaxID=1572645 RepID=UPI00373685D0